MEFRDLHEVVWSRNWSLIMPYTSIRSVERCLITDPLAMPNSCQAIRQILYNLSNHLARSSIFLVWNGQYPKYPKSKHLKGQLDPPVSDVTFLDQGGQLDPP